MELRGISGRQMQMGSEVEMPTKARVSPIT
jgi:hypothetical protein